LPRGRILVAIFALYEGMRPNQRESILVILNRLQRNLPSFHRVAVRAIGSELAAMDVGVAIRAVGSGVGKHGLGVALSASHALVQAPKRILCLVVIEFRDGSNRLPANRRVAVLARNV